MNYDVYIPNEKNSEGHITCKPLYNATYLHKKSMLTIVGKRVKILKLNVYKFKEWYGWGIVNDKFVKFNYFKIQSIF
jgi:hypothetical protein